MKRRGRYAPSPSGQMHIGNARTALLAWLQMRSCGGTFILRMEDIDKPRCRPEYAAQLIRDLRWMGLDWDEGPDVGGPFFPYTQSEREAQYKHALDRLQQGGSLYACTCTRAKLNAIASAPHGLSSEGPVYPGTCRRHPVPASELCKPHSLRFTMPSKPVVFEDGLMGTQRFEPGAGGDFVVRRSDGIYGYQLAVVVDDAAMGITDVLRGDDLLDSTPRQLCLFEALGQEPPVYAHIPLLYGSDGHRLSKRHGSVSVASLRDSGVKPEKLVGYLAYWSGLIDQPVSISPHELAQGFRLSEICRNSVTVSDESLALLLT